MKFLGGTGLFTAGALSRLGEWVVWFQAAIVAHERGDTIDPLPAAKEEANESLPTTADAVRVLLEAIAAFKNHVDDGAVDRELVLARLVQKGFQFVREIMDRS